mgnify:CR=1 FL=1
MSDTELAVIAGLHNQISDFLDCEWGEGWSYTIENTAITFRWQTREPEHSRKPCTCSLPITTLDRALHDFLYLLTASRLHRQEADKTRRQSQLQPLQRQQANEEELAMMKGWFAFHTDIYDRHFARRLSQTGAKTIKDLTADELQQLYHLWQEYISLKQETL